jgi:selenocysteine lyase/cysteine desulfurase
MNLGDLDSAVVSDWLWEDAGICVRPGAHCAPRMHEALGTEKQGAVRFSFSHYNTEQEVETVIRVVRDLAE